MSLETDKNRNVWRYPDVPHLEGLFPCYVIQLIKRKWAQSRPLPQGLLFPEMLLEAGLPNWSPRAASRLLPWTVPKLAFALCLLSAQVPVEDTPFRSIPRLHLLPSLNSWSASFYTTCFYAHCVVFSQYFTVSFVYPVYFTRFQRGTSKGSH